MATVKSIIDDVIFEEKNETLKLFYNIDVFIQEFKDKKEEEPVVEPEVTQAPTAPEVPPVVPAPDAAPAVAPTEGFDENGNLLTESIFKQKVEGELTVPKQDAENIQTIQDLIDYLSDKQHSTEKKSVVQKVLDKKGKAETKGKILSPVIQEVILLLSGLGGEENLGDIVDKGDKVIVQLQYGNNKSDNIGLKINKNSGTEVFSIMIVKDGEILPGKFDQTLINKQILFYRNSIA